MQNDIEDLFFKYYDEVNGWNYYVAYTEWFPADVKPVHVGWYECKSNKGNTVCGFKWWWNGSYWTMKLDDYDFVTKNTKCSEQNRVWRGLCVPIRNIIN